MKKAALKKLETIELGQGNHKSIKDGACVMELVSYVAGEPWSDHPECACPVLTAYAIRLNDGADDETRQLLKPLVLKLIGTRNGAEKARYEYLALQSITVFLPILTDALGLIEISKVLRSFKVGQWIEARKYINEQRPTIRKAAYAYAYAASAYAASASAYAADASAYAYAASAYAAAAYAASAASASASASAASAEKKTFWLDIRNKVWMAAISALEQAIEIGKEK